MEHEQRVLEALIVEAATAFGLRRRSEWTQEASVGLSKTISRHGGSPIALAERAQREPSLLTEFAGHLTINETYFFRHEVHFEILRRHCEAWLQRSDTSGAPADAHLVGRMCDGRGTLLDRDHAPSPLRRSRRRPVHDCRE